jgi:hypothetical protein
MNRYLLLIALCFQILFSSSQSFLNGDFEKNNSTDCDYNLTDSDFNKKMSNVYAFGKKFTFSNKHKGEIDILTNGCFVDPQNGNWCIGLAVDTTTDAVAIKLTSELVVGQSYKLSLFIYANTSFGSGMAPIEIGESISDSTFGIKIDTLIPVALQWRECTLNFTATRNSKYITVRNMLGIKAWNQVDNFSISEITSTHEFENGELDFTIFPNPSDHITTIAFNQPIIFKLAKVYNLYGECILISESCNIDLTNMSAGSYIVYIITSDGIASKRLIKI